MNLRNLQEKRRIKIEKRLTELKKQIYVKGNTKRTKLNRGDGYKSKLNSNMVGGGGVNKEENSA